MAIKEEYADSLAGLWFIRHTARRLARLPDWRLRLTMEEAVEAAKVNAGLNGLSNCEFIAGDVLKVVGELKDKPDFIVLDPPRDGIHPKAIEKIIDFGVDRMVYVSCKPTSLARDLEILTARGYQAEKVCCVDMFPATGNCETVCLLTRVK